MTKEQKSAAYYAVVPAPVRYDPELSPSAKLLYCEITSLCTSKGYCWATNEYFTRLFELSASTISRLISQLERRGHVRIKTVATKTGSERRIYTDVYRVELLSEEGAQRGTQKEQAPQGGCAKTARGAAQKEQGGVRKNRKQNDYQENDYSEYPPIVPQPGDGERGGPAKTQVDKPAPRPDVRRTRFVPPDVEQVRAYCRERGNGIDPEAFVDHYTAKGWMVGRSPMKDWRAAVRTWEQRRRSQGKEAGGEDDWYE